MKLLSVLFIVSINYVLAERFVPVISLAHEETVQNTTNKKPMKFLPFIMLIEKDKDTSEYWRETEVLSLVQNNDADIDFEQCNTRSPEKTVVQFPSLRTIRPICKTTYDYQLCPQCPRFSNETECALFRDSCKERRVYPSEYRTYCDKRYGKWRAMFIPADPVQCRCCDECVFYRELDQSCVQDEYNFDADEFLPVTTLDFRAGCNPYWGHPEQELRALRCDKILRRFSGWELTKSPATASVNIIRLITGVPVTIPILPSETLNVRRSFRFEPPSAEDCPVWCRGWECAGGQVSESRCPLGAFLPDRDTCNCCGRCSTYQQLNQKCAEFKKTVHNINGTKETEVEEEFLEPGCDDGLVCRQGLCQDIHAVHSATGVRRKRDEGLLEAYEPCKKELKYFKKKYGKDGHLHFNAPQCTPLWLYAAVQVDLYREITFRNSGQTYRGVPVMASNMDTVGTFEMAKELSKHGLFTCIHKYYSLEEWKKFAEENPKCLEQMAASSGTAEADFDRLSEILNSVEALKFICLDVANGYSQHFVEYLRRVRAGFPTHTIIAGNVVTGEMVEELILSGADIIKVGIGPGSVCTTRMKTGVGYPQLSAVIECADAAHGLKGHIISDGGCTCPGDVAKAFGAGADFVMAGGMFAGHDQCAGDLVSRPDGRQVKLFYGMSSATAMLKHSGGVAEYRSSEGKTVEIEYRGNVEGTVKDILGGLRSACTYVGAARLRELPRRATFIRCCRQVNDVFS